MRRKMSQTISVVIVAALFGMIVKLSVEPHKAAPRVNTISGRTIHGIYVALPQGMQSIPPSLLPQP